MNPIPSGYPLKRGTSKFLPKVSVGVFDFRDHILEIEKVEYEAMGIAVKTANNSSETAKENDPLDKLKRAILHVKTVRKSIVRFSECARHASSVFLATQSQRTGSESWRQADL